VDSTAFVSQIVEAIRKVVGPGPVALHEPSFDGNEWIYLKECLDSNYVSSVGKCVDQFELSLANYTGAKYAISVVNGTAALHLLQQQMQFLILAQFLTLSIVRKAPLVSMS